MLYNNDMGKKAGKAKKRDKKYTGVNAKQSTGIVRVHKVNAVVRSDFGQWIFEHKTMLKNIAIGRDCRWVYGIILIRGEINIMARISIIEDDQLIAQMYRMKLEEEGYDVDVAENGMNGIKMVAQTMPDLIILDYTLPDVDGSAVLREIRRDGTAVKTPVIVLTNMDSEDVASELAKWNIVDYIVKVNLTPREVVAKIKSVLGE